MRTKNEKILLAILVTMLFLGGNFFGYQWITKKQTRLNQTYAELRADRDEAEFDLRQKDHWAPLKTWMEAHQPVLGDEGDTKAQVLQFVKNGAHDHHLDIIEQSVVNDVEHDAAGARISVSLKVKGPMEGLCEWLATLQKPDSFYAVSLFSLKADEDQKSMMCTLQLDRYFKEGS
ncbi:MAG TPA: hypothetical protein VL981_00705 [Candidatus Methylacidiphilales bacterium]|nr:hypothetical protein [Candidatus Methylacidiphilales bacterium]